MTDRKSTRSTLQHARKAGNGAALALRSKPPTVRRGKHAVDLGVLDDRLGYFIRRAQIWVFQDFIRGLASVDLSPAQFSVVAVIGANPGLSQAALSGTLGIERARLARMLHELGRRGLTQRLPSSKDARSHELQLTAEGQKTLARAKALSEEHEGRLMKKFGADRYKAIKAILRDF
ncbi:MAG: MarR family winged helix-turn-helix transcriptional regulator [Pseudolabrys sp.]